MKRIIVILIACVLYFTGCASQTANNKEASIKKRNSIKIYSTQNELLSTVNDQDMINDLLNNDDWSEVNNLPDDLTMEYKLLVYQEKTLLAGQDSNEERDYELIETIVLFQDSPYVAEIISSDVVKTTIPSDALTFYYKLPNSTIESIENLLNSDLS